VATIPEPSAIVLAAFAAGGVVGFSFRRPGTVQTCKALTNDDALVSSRRSFLRKGLVAIAAMASAVFASDRKSRAARWAASERCLGPNTMHVADVRDFGAKGDGITDDAPAFQAAINSFCIPKNCEFYTTPAAAIFSAATKPVIRDLSL
jgi:hypothetical protein